MVVVCRENCYNMADLKWFLQKKKEGMTLMYHIIVNKKSRSGRGEKLWPVIQAELTRRDTVFRAYPTKYHGNARETAARLTAEGVWNPDDVLLVIGGDGTANEAVDGICHPSEVKFGYIPTGSGNDFARGAGIPSEPLQALEAALKGEEKKINIGTALVGGEKRRFLVSTGIGFDAGICHEALTSKIKNTLNRLHFGKLTYVMIAMRQLFYLEPFTLDLMLENGESRHFEQVLFAVAMNLPYEGGGFRFCPQADETDDLLDVMVVSNLAKWKVSYLLPMALVGRHTGFPEVHMERCSSLSIQTDRAEPVHLDGESGGRRMEETIGLETERLRLLGDWVKEGI